MKYQIINGNNIDVLKTFPDNHFDSIVTDPPYGIDFLGKAWDANTGALETYQQCLRVLKPGGHILAFSAARTYHHLAITLEQAGFEIRDQIMWIYSSGFPKSQDIGKQIQKKLGVKETKKATGPKSTTPRKNNYKNTLAEAQGNDRVISDDYDAVDIIVPTDPEAQQWSGWGTALKPAHEPIALARKPIKLSIAKNCQQYGVGALNIDATRIESDEPLCGSGKRNEDGTYTRHTGKEFGQGMMPQVEYDPNQGRFPSNVLGDIPDYQKYFYCPKVSRKERHIGMIDPGPQTRRARDADGNVLNYAEKKPGASANVLVEQFQLSDKGNNHPTVKPIELMKYLIKLVTPAGGRVLDPFNGSGSTGCAAVELGCEYVGIELDPAYVEIAKKRIEAWNKQDTNFEELFV